MIKKVGVVAYGLVGISNIFVMSGYLSLLEIGFQASITKYTAEFYAKNEKQKICQLLNSTLAIFLGAGIILMLVGILTSNFLVNHLLQIPEEHRHSFLFALHLIFVSYLFQFPTIVYAGFFEGVQRFDILKGVQTITAVASAASTILFLSLGYGYVSIIVCTTAPLVIQFFIYAYLSHKIFPFLELKYIHLSFAIIREIWRTTKLLFVGKLSGFIYNNSSRILISLFLSPTLMTTYEVVMRLPRFLKTALGFTNSAVMPAASALRAAGREESLKRLFLQGVRYQIFFTAPVIIGAMFFAKEFLVTWIGPDFGRFAPLMQLLLVWNMTMPFWGLGNSMSLGMNSRLKQFTAMSILATLISIGVSILFIWKYELRAVIAGFVLASLLPLPFLLNMFMKEFGVTALEFIKIVLPPLAVAIVPILVFIPFNLPTSLPILMLKTIVWCLIYWSALYALVANAEDRKTLRDLILMRFLVRRPA